MKDDERTWREVFRHSREPRDFPVDECALEEAPVVSGVQRQIRDFPFAARERDHMFAAQEAAGELERMIAWGKLDRDQRLYPRR